MKERVEVRSFRLLTIANGMPVTLRCWKESGKRCEPLGSAICAKRNRSLATRDCFERPGASLISDSSSAGMHRSSTSVPFWQHCTMFMVTKRSAPQCSHTSRCSKKLMGCACSRWWKLVAFCAHSLRYAPVSASVGRLGTAAAPRSVGAAAHAIVERLLFVLSPSALVYSRSSVERVNVSKRARSRVSGAAFARLGMRSSSGSTRNASSGRDESIAAVSHGSSLPFPSTSCRRAMRRGLRFASNPLRFILCHGPSLNAFHDTSVSPLDSCQVRKAASLRKSRRPVFQSEKAPTSDRSCVLSCVPTSLRSRAHSSVDSTACVWEGRVGRGPSMVRGALIWARARSD
mmetsp:Transcript_41204/g.98958  ORF Transcript_41204/g.98958 Transcript_41204/m.98958 type:complete len:345 (-) Transcript_41204:353-1387(-)